MIAGSIAAGLLAAGLLAALGNAAPAAAEELRITFAAPNAIYWDTDVAIEKGFFKEQGFEVKRVTLVTSVAAAQQLISGTTNLAGGSPEPVIQAYMRGEKDVGLLTAGCNKIDWTFNVTPDVKTLADLKGKKIGVSSIHGGESTLVRQMLAKAGLKFGKDYTYIQIGISPLKLAAMLKGSVSGAALFQPSGFTAESKGLKSIVDMSKLPSYPFPVFSVSRTWAKQNKRGERVVAALRKAQAWVHQPANRAEATAILAKYTKASPALAKKVVDFYLGPSDIYNTDARIDRKGLTRLLDIMVEQGLLKAKPKSVDELVLPYAGLK
jgi:NitT/TauT family transport system substrate-binding protein